MRINQFDYHRLKNNRNLIAFPFENIFSHMVK